MLFQDLVDALAGFALLLPNHAVSGTVQNSIFSPVAGTIGKPSSQNLTAVESDALICDSPETGKKYLTSYTVCHTVSFIQYTRYGMTLTENLFENLRMELRRGCLTLAVLAQLKQEHYGYTLRKALAGRGMEIDESTLYPLLRRLEAQGLLTSEWREEEKRNKRFYRLSSDGVEIFTRLLGEWNAINTAIGNLL